MAITKNLYEALLRMRHPERLLRLWAEVLCISQDGLDERKGQVRLMGRVYTQAETCLVWLGEHTERDGLAFKLLVVLENYLQSKPSDETGRAAHSCRED